MHPSQSTTVSAAPAAAPSGDVRLRRFFVGAASATLSAAALQPFDVVRSVQQAAPSLRGGGPLATATSLVAREGWRALWKGLAPAALRVAGGAGLYFSSLGAAQAALASPSSSALPAAARDLAAGAAARALAAAVMLPISVVKTRAELAPPGDRRFDRPLAGLAAVARADGAGALLRGYLPTLARDAPFSGIYFACYSAMRRALDEPPLLPPAAGGGAALPAAALPPWARNFGAALLSGAVASIITQPADVLKTRQQMPRAASAGAADTTLRDAIAQRGLRVLFVGGGARLAKRALSTAITWTLFEAGMGGAGA